MGRSAIHPGEHLAEQLEALSMSAAELARHLKVPKNRITEILNGRRAITGDTALRLGHFFGTSPEFWLNLQKIYELRLAEAKSWETIKGLPTLGKARMRQRDDLRPSRGERRQQQRDVPGRKYRGRHECEAEPDKKFSEENIVRKKSHPKLVHAGEYVGEVDLERIYPDEG